MTDPAATGRLGRYYGFGQAAGLRGSPLDACRYRRPDRVNAWVRGWHAGEALRLRLEAFQKAWQAAGLACSARKVLRGGTR